MQAAYSMGPGGDLNARKQALIKKLSGQNKGSGGAARLTGSTPFGALPRLGFNPNARSVFGRGEQFNFAGGPPGFQQAAESMGQAVGGQGAFAPPAAPPTQGMADLSGVGAAAGAGSGSPGIPQGVGGGPPTPPPAAGMQSSYGADSSPWHLLDNGGQPANAQGATGAVPANVQQALDSGVMSGGVSAWLRQNPWFIQQMMGGSSGGAVL